MSDFSDAIRAQGLAQSLARQAAFDAFHRAVQDLAATAPFGPPSKDYRKALLQSSLIQIACALMGKDPE